jgi:hypothetical protein
MAKFPHWLCHLQQLAGTLLTVLVDVLRYVALCLHSPAALAAENLFLRKHLLVLRGNFCAHAGPGSVPCPCGVLPPALPALGQ